MIKYVIATNKDTLYLNVATNRLINTLKEAGVRECDIIVYVGRSSTQFDEEVNGITYKHYTWGAYEHTPLVAISEDGLDADYVFPLHDTCEVGPNFRKLVEQGADFTKDMTVLHGAMCGFGLYSVTFLKRVRNLLIPLKNCDKHTAMVHEGFLYRQNLGSVAAYTGAWQDCGMCDPYRTGHQRLREYYSHVDLYKNKANFGQTNPSTYIQHL